MQPLRVLTIVAIGAALVVTLALYHRSRGDEAGVSATCVVTGTSLGEMLSKRLKGLSKVKPIATLLEAAGADLVCKPLARALVVKSPKKVPFELKTAGGTKPLEASGRELLAPPVVQPATNDLSLDDLSCLRTYARSQFMLELCRNRVLPIEPSGDDSPTVPFSDLVADVETGVVRVEAETCDGDRFGTGVLVNPQFVATVEHVVAGASKLTLKRNGEMLATARVVGSDPDRDLALLQTSEEIAGHNFKFAVQEPRLGEDVAVLGFPLGLPLTVTKGSVSGLSRTIPIDGVERRQLIQTDAAVNQGNSGGPLLSTESGNLVGLVDLTASGANGIAFAVSARVASPLVEAWRTAPQPAAEMTCEDVGPTTGSSAAVAGATPADYAEAVDTALLDSARTRGDLGDLISRVSAGSIEESEALSAIDDIIDQRQALLSDVTDVSAPDAFRRSATLLRSSLRAALADDLVIENWIKAKYAGDDATAARYWSRQRRLSNRATSAKAAFLRTYNDVRRELLGLPQLEVEY